MGKNKGRGDDTQPKKPETKNFKKTTSRLRHGRENHLGHRASLQFREDTGRVCDAGSRAEDILPIETFRTVLMKSRTAEALFSAVSAKGVSICYDEQTPGSQYYFQDGACIIAVNPHRPKSDILNSLARELRRAWQHINGALVNPLDFEPEEAILVNRAQQADVLMVSVKIAWELKLCHEHEAWNGLVGSPMADVSRTFEIKAQSDFRSLNNGEAARAAYDKFFEDSRTKTHDKRIIHQMLLDESGYIRSDVKRSKVSPDLFKKLGELPHGRNYLMMRNARSPVDLCYATVEDRANANFLWFIKFERSFHEKEKQMIEESVKLSAEIVDFAKWATRLKPASQ